MSEPMSKDAHSIAITGLSCRFPSDGDSLDTFWEFICKARSAWSEIPKDRFNVDAFWAPSKNRNTSTTRGAHFLKQDISKFDANFFNFSKAEADAMDPQHRMMKEVTYEALENAGLPLSQLAGSRTGVFMGQFTSDYREMMFKDSESAPVYSATGSSKTSLANRISWLFDLKGPSFTMDTACSSSLVALHLACQSLRTGESDIAIVGGVNILLNPDMFLYLSNQNFLSPDGLCKSFDESGNGYGRGEGFAAIVLRRVHDAITFGDPIRAVIRGTASNQDGHTKGFTLPSADAQAALIEDTYRGAGLDFMDTHYFEAHGTGTQAGDTEETEALSRTISKVHSPEHKLLVGSVKSNIGHLEACAGLAAVVKAVLILESGIIPPTIHFKNGNPKIRFEEWNLKVPTELTPWPTHGLRRISTNSFGYGGTNAHAILDDAYHYLKVRGIKGNHYTRPPSQANGVITINDTNGMNGHGKTNGVNWWNESPKVNGVSPTITSRNGPRLFVVSAQDKEGLKRVKLRLAGFLDKKPEDIKDGSEKGEAFLADLAYSLSARRSALQWKTYGIASSLEELSQVLRDDQATAVVKRSSRNPRIGFVFTGQGAQWPRMGAGLMEYKIFRESIQAADKYLREECECTWSAAEELQKNKSTSQLHLAAYSQTLCTVLQVALVELLKTWNILPVAVAGHSSGEISAAYCMGAITKEDAWKIAFWRGILSSGMKDTDPDVEGTMIAVGASPKVAQMWISKVSSGEVVVACINSPSSVTLSGDTTGIDELAGLLKEEGIFARKLQVDTAYHSPHMQMVASDYFEAIADVETLTPAGDCKMHSSVTGFAIEASELGPANWVRNLTSPVQFASAIHDMLRPMQNGVRATENAVDLLVEIGPHSALQGPATQTLKAHGITNIPYQSAIIRNQGAITSALELAGALFAQGFPVDVRHANNDVGTMASYAPKPLVDLPAYPWNHSQKYWAESRIGKEYRLREKPQMSLLGAPSSTTAAGECVWRKFIRLSEEPWVSDHKIQGSILYPAAGFLAMAIEAGAQTADSTRIVASFKLRDIQLTAAAVITDQDDLEFTLQLRPHMTGTRDKGSAWTEFMVSSSADGANLQKNCSGLLIIEYESEAGSETRREKDLEDIESKRLCLEATQQCVTHVSPAKFYADIAALGLIYGPAFANLTQIQSKDKQAFGAVQIPDIPIQVNERIQDRPHIIHPGTLDAIFHLAFAAAKGGKDQLHSAMVPRSIDEVVISANISYKPGTRLTGFSNAAKHGFKELQANIVMLDEQKNFPVVRIAGFCCNEVGGGNSASAEQTAAKNICSKLTWKPAIELLSAEEQKTWIESVEEIVLNDNLKNTIEEEDASALKCIDQVVRAISEDEVTPTQKELFTWMKSKPVKLFSSNKLDIQSTALIQQLKSHLLGEINEHELSNDEDVLHRLFLETQSTTAVLSKLSAYLNLLHHSKPQLSILETHTGSGPMLLFPKLESIQGVLKTGDYTISCSNGDTNSKVEKRISSLDGNVKFGVLEIDQDLEAQQEMKDRKFDVIVAFNITYGAQRPDVALSNVKKLLKPGGVACFIEVINPGPRLSMLGCSTSKSDQLEHLLQRHDFKARMTFRDFEEAEFQQLGLVIGAVDETSTPNGANKEIVLIEAANPSQAAKEVTAQLAMSLESKSYKTAYFVWGSDVSMLKGKHCIALMELDDSLLRDLNEKDFNSSRKVILEAASTFWVVGHNDPSAAMIDGLARVVRNETPGLSIRTFHYNEGSNASNEKTGELIARTFHSTTTDDEFMIKDGVVNVSRVGEDGILNDEIEGLLPSSGKKVAKMQLGQTHGAQKLCVLTPGMLGSLAFETDEDPQTDLPADMIEIYVKATALNFREVMSALGQIPDTFLGLDAAGIVRRVGSAVSKFKIGDKVAMFALGSHRTICRSRADYCELIPDGLSFEEAATVPVVHGTAWYGLVKLARVKKGQSILIHAAAGGVGQAAIQIAKHFGMEIFATVGSEIKRKLLRDEYQIPDDHILNSRDLSFVKGIKRMTGGRGVDVVLNSLSGEALRQTWYCIAPFGHFLEIGIKDILANTELDMRPFLQDASFTFFNLKHISEIAVESMAELLAGTWNFQRRGITRPISPVITYPISEVENAFRLMQTGKHVGKIALTWSDDAVVPIVQGGVRNLELDPNATYMLVGGLGGLGRSLSTMLVDHGARKLCFLSRFGDKSSQAQSLIRDLRKSQIQFQTYACDVADEQAVKNAVAQCSQELGTIKGVFQCAMVLRDTLFTNMTYQEWLESTRPKVQGSWNLHEQLKGLDFFVTLSSFAAIFGNRGQSNYAAAGAYEDALAHYRRAHGLRAVTLDLGIMRDVGVLAEKGMVETLREWEEPYGIRAHEFHALMERAVSGDINGDLAPQVLTGLATGGSAIAAGINTPFYLEDARFSIMMATGLGKQSDTGKGDSVPTQVLIAQSTSLEEAAGYVTEALVNRVAKILQTSTSEIDSSRFLHSYGIDSLVGIEIVNWALKEIKSSITVFDVMAGIPITTTAAKIAFRSAVLPKELVHG